MRHRRRRARSVATPAVPQPSPGSRTRRRCPTPPPAVARPQHLARAAEPLDPALGRPLALVAPLAVAASWAVDASEIRFGRRLGAGAYGEVYARVAPLARGGEAAAAVAAGARVKAFFAEMEILANARHDHIVRFRAGAQPDNMCIVFEFCPQSLYDLLRQQTAALELRRVLTIARQVALGIYYLRRCQAARAPPRPQERPTSCSTAYGNTAKVCDFGLAHQSWGRTCAPSAWARRCGRRPRCSRGGAQREGRHLLVRHAALRALNARAALWGYAARSAVMGVIQRSRAPSCRRRSALPREAAGAHARVLGL